MSKFLCCIREYRNRKSQKAISSHFKENPCKNNASCRGCFHVSIWKPCMEGEHGNFYCKSEEEGKENPILLLVWQMQTEILCYFKSRNPCYLFVKEIESDDADKHEDAAGHSEQDEFDGCIYFPRSTPDTNDEIHGYQGCFPEDIKENHIEGAKDTEHARL